jgi:hypothetical protein
MVPTSMRGKIEGGDGIPDKFDEDPDEVKP